MCEFLVRVVDRPRTGDPRKDCLRLGRGDVVVVQEDGRYWGPKDRSNPHWLIVKCPGMTLAEGRALAAPEPRVGPKQKGPAPRYRHKRLYRLDVDTLIGPPNGAGRRAAECVKKSVTAVRGAKRTKPAVLDPAVLGSQKPSYVLG